MIKVLANDGLETAAVERLTSAGIEVSVKNISDSELMNRINEFDVITVRSATKIRVPLINQMQRTKLIIRAGVGMDNIDIEAAQAKGIQVKNTATASSLSVAELAIGHLFSLCRFLFESNKTMPTTGLQSFKELKNKYSSGCELRGKTLGIIGLGNIGIETAKIALGLGMNVVASGRKAKTEKLSWQLGNGIEVSTNITTISKEELLSISDFISIHSSGSKQVLFEEDYMKMKTGVGIINCARGGVIKEKELIQYLNNGKVAFAGIDVFEEEPTKNEELLKHPRVSLTPHIGASTVEAQARVGSEVANIIFNFANGKN